jgi:hydrogenase maturation protease
MDAIGTLVLGIGNDILMDDGIGPKLVSELKNSQSVSGIDYKVSATGGLEILELIRDYKRVIILDAIKTENGIPGTIYHFDPSGFKETLHISSFHDVSFLTALEMAGMLKINIPDQIEIIAIEIVEDMTFGSDLTPVLQEKFHEILREIKDCLRNLAA